MHIGIRVLKRLCKTISITNELYNTCTICTEVFQKFSQSLIFQTHGKFVEENRCGAIDFSNADVQKIEEIGET